MPQLDSLRAFAVIAVLQHHYTEWSAGVPGWIQPWYPGGAWGVQLFFVLSGFLITGLLLDARRDAEEARVERSVPLRRFYARRFLRIFPVYYATLLVAAVLNFGSVRKEWPWHAFYGSNFLFAANAVWSDSVNHFWSLAVEEQFYMVWPWLVLFVPWRALPATMIAVGLTAPLFRGITALVGWNDIARMALLPDCIDALAAGGLLAWALRFRPREGVHRALRWALGLGGALMCAVSYVPLGTAEKLTRGVVVYLALTLIFVWLVGSATKGFRGPFGRLLESRALRYIGTISYGIYLFHLFTPKAMEMLQRRTGVPLPTTSFAKFVVYGLLTVGGAALSWRFFEKPINDLKSRFPYVGPTPSRDPAVAATAAAASER